MSSYRKTMRQVREEMLVISEAKYELYHKDFSGAMQHAYKMAKKLHGITIDPKEIDDKVATGPRKPSEGDTNKYRLKGDKGGIQVQVYNKGGSKPFELNFYKEEVELDEYGGNFGGGPMRVEKGKKKKEGVDEGTKQILAHGGKGKYKVTKDGDTIEIKFGGKVVGTADFDRGADSFFVSIKGEKGQKSFDDAQAIADYFAKNKITEEVDLDEAEDFKSHKMYDPKTGKAYDAKTMDDHLKYKKMGYSHEKPEVEENGEINEFIPAILGVAARAVLPAVAGAMMNKKKEKEVDEGAASDARRAIALDPSTKQKFSKNVSATDDDIKSADKNIMMQMRKAVSLRGNKVEFMDKKKVEIPQKIAQAVLDKYNSQKKPADKEKFQTKVSKSYKNMLSALKERNEINNKNNSLHELKSLVREMKGKNNG